MWRGTWRWERRLEIGNGNGEFRGSLVVGMGKCREEGIVECSGSGRVRGVLLVFLHVFTVFVLHFLLLGLRLLARILHSSTHLCRFALVNLKRKIFQLKNIRGRKPIDPDLLESSTFFNKLVSTLIENGFSRWLIDEKLNLSRRYKAQLCDFISQSRCSFCGIGDDLP